MFPQGLLFFILIVVIDLILKSIKDKQKIQKAKSKKWQQINKEPRDGKSIIASPIQRKETIRESNRKIEQEQVKEKRVPSRDESIFKNEQTREKSAQSKVYRSEMELIVEDNFTDKRSKKSKIPIKKDILKGIIYSEILSEPKSLRNKRKSI